MPHSYKLGRKPSVPDHRVPHFSIHSHLLPHPPPNSNWYAAVQNWGMLLNDQYGDCVIAAAYHAILEMTTYAGNPIIPTDAEAEAAYSGATGFDPKDPSTDQGTVVMGHGGFMEYWTNTGLMIGGSKVNKLDAYFQITRMNAVEWMKAVHYFGGFMFGFNVPESIMAADQPPFVWNDPSGPFVGGHEVWVCGYETVGSGMVLFDLVSWGARYRMTVDFMEKVGAEIVVPYDSLSLNAQGLNGAGLTKDQLTADMSALRQEAGF